MNANVRTFLMLLSFSVFTGATFHLAQYTVDSFSASGAAAWRFGLAAAAMLAILAFRRRADAAVLKQNAGIYALMGLIGICGFNAFFFLGMKLTSPVNGALIMATNPLLTTLLSRFALGVPIARRQALGIAISFAGVVLVLTQGSWAVIASLDFSRGDLYMLLGNLCWALYGVLGKRYVRSGDSLQLTTYTMTVGAIALMGLSLLQRQPVPVADVPAGAWGAILFMACFTSVLGYLFWNEGVRQWGANRTSVFFNLVPVVAMLISIAGGTAITGAQTIGALAVLAGVATASGLGRRARPLPAAS